MIERIRLFKLSLQDFNLKKSRFESSEDSESLQNPLEYL